MSTIPKPIRREVTLTKAYKAVFNSPDGQLVLRDMLVFSGMMEAKPAAVEDANYDGGMRGMVLHVLDRLRMDETRLLELVQARMDENEPEE